MTTCTICGLASAVPLSDPPSCVRCGRLDEVAREVEFPPETPQTVRLDIGPDDPRYQQAMRELTPDKEGVKRVMRQVQDGMLRQAVEQNISALTELCKSVDELKAALQEGISLGDAHLIRMKRSLRGAWIRDSILFGLGVAVVLVWWL